MNSSNFFSILKLLEKYTYLHKEDGKILFKADTATINENSNKRIFIIDEDKLQTNFREPKWKEYSYFFSQNGNGQLKPFAKVHAFLQGAIIDKKISEAPDQAFVDYQKNVLKLQFGMFTFIDPTISQDAEEQKPYYLLGPMVGKLLQPSFNFKFYYNVENFRGNDEFIEPPNDWLRFFLAFNEFSRDAVTFYNQDFVKIFNYKKYEEKRNKAIERANNILYISSGEMDTCILQWLFLYLKSTNGLRDSDNILDSRFSIDLKVMYEKISEFYNNNEEANYIIPNYRSEAKVFKTPSKKFYTWLQLWGLLNTDGLPSERLLAAFEWLYYYLKLFETGENDKYYDYRKYLTLVEIDQKDPTYYYLQGIDSKIRNKYFTAIEALLPVQLNYEWRLNTDKKEDFEKLAQLYFEILFSWDERNIEIEKASAKSWEVFAERCRFRPFVHFLYRNFPSSVNRSFIEKTCRGFIAFPILSSHKSYAGDPPNRNTKPNDIHYYGYFLGHFKDSDSKGRCLFNWHKNTDYNVSETVKSIYEDNFFELRQIINQLGRIEREQIYFRGIVRMHQEEAKKQAIHSAVAACMSRNLSHTTGSHKSPWFKNYFNSFFKEIIQFYKGNMDQLPDGIASGLKSIKGVKKINVLRQHAEGEVANLQNHLLNYFDFVNDNMEFIADVTTSYTANKVTFSYSIKDIYEEYGSLKLMHHGLFDDKKMEVSIKLIYHEDPSNKYKNAVVALPNGQLGKTAFFIIIENILRNYYKHTTHENNEPKFFIRITPSSLMPDDFWCVDFYDLIANDENKQKRTAELLNRINGDFIENSILQANGTLRQEGWGFIEMKACAAYLVNFPIENIDQEADKSEHISISSTEKFHPLIKAGFYSNEGILVNPQQDYGNRNLGYRFYLKKAKEIGIEEALIKSGQAQRININLAGVDVLKKDALSGTQYDILILQSINETVDLNQRVIVDNHFEVNNYDSVEDVKLFAWQQYIHRFLPRYDFVIARSSEELHEALKTKRQRKIVFIDDHGRIFKENSWSYNYLKKFLWYLPDENRTRKDIALFNQEKNSLTIKCRLIEAIYTKISIYDERIQQEISNPYNNIPQISLRELHLLGKIFVPEIETENLTDDAVVKNLEGLLKKRFKTDDYVIVHFTLFEKLAESKGYSTSIKGDNNLKKYYEKLVGEWKLETRGKFLVFCSGRGRPSNLFPGCYYLHLSTLQYFLIRSISKYSLVNVLKSLRKL